MTNPTNTPELLPSAPRFVVTSHKADCFILGRYDTIEQVEKATGGRRDIWVVYDLLEQPANAAGTRPQPATASPVTVKPLSDRDIIGLLNFSSTFDSVGWDDLSEYVDRIKERFSKGTADIDEVVGYCADKFTKTCAGVAYKNMKRNLQEANLSAIQPEAPNARAERERAALCAINPCGLSYRTEDTRTVEVVKQHIYRLIKKGFDPATEMEVFRTEPETVDWDTPTPAPQTVQEAAYLAGFMASGEGWNGEHEFPVPKLCLADWRWIEKRDEDLAALRAISEQNTPAHSKPQG